MPTTALFAEYIVIGSFVLATIIFFVFDPRDLGQRISNLKDFMVPLTTIGLVVSYALGALVNRILSGPVMNNLIAVTRKWVLPIKSRSSKMKMSVANILYSFIGGTGGFPTHYHPPNDGEEWEQWIEGEIVVAQKGSDALVKTMEYEESLLRIFRSLAVITPVLAFAFFRWSFHEFTHRSKWLLLGGCFLITYVFIVAWNWQLRAIREEMILAVRYLQKEETAKQDNSGIAKV